MLEHMMPLSGFILIFMVLFLEILKYTISTRVMSMVLNTPYELKERFEVLVIFY